MKKYFCLTIIFVCLSIFSAEAAVAPELLQALGQVYGGQFNAANGIISPYITAHPAESDGYLLRGIAREWYAYMTFKRATLDSQIMGDYEKARQLADAALEKDPDNTENKIKLANAYVYVSKKQLDMGHKMQAGSSLKRAKNLMQEVLGKDPNNPEAYFAIGLFNYFSDNVPAGFRWLASLLGFKGDRRVGKDYITRASLVPNLTQTDALYMLFYIAARKEHDYAQAANYSQELVKRYPDNNIYRALNVEMLFRTKKIPEARAEFAVFESQCNALGNECNKSTGFLSYFFMTKTSLEEKNMEMARQYYQKAMAFDQKNEKGASAKLAEWKDQIFGQTQ